MNIIFDLDSTLTTIEGIDELGVMKNLQERITTLTNKAMSGKIPLSEVFEERLSILKPTQDELSLISELYLKNITPYASELIRILKKKHRVFIVTGGYETCVLPVAKYLEVDRIYANKIIFNQKGEYVGLDKTIPLWRNGGKGEIVQLIKKTYPGQSMMIGDGFSDLEAGADKFVCFAGVMQRKEVMKEADHIIYDLRKVLNFV